MGAAVDVWEFYPTIYWGGGGVYLSMFGLNLVHVGKKDTGFKFKGEAYDSTARLATYPILLKKHYQTTK